MRKETDFMKAWEYIQREGARDMLAWLREETDFFEAPASAGHHLACEGGLVKHSLNVYNRLCEITHRDADVTPQTMDTVAMLGLLHDVCKVGVYHKADPFKAVLENKLDPYTFRDPFPLGHGEKSLFLIARFMPLTNEEALAIRWHMGAYDSAVKGGSSDINAALRLSPWLWRLQEADMCATYIDEVDA